MIKKVKNTTFVGLLDLLAPHSCRGCGRLGEVLCDCCKKNIVCCNFHYDKRRFMGLPEVYTVGSRDGLLGELIQDYKYFSVRAIGVKLAEMMSEKLPRFLNAFIVPLPTSTKHIRERGFDHTLFIAKRIARLRGLRIAKILSRNRNTVQVGADRKMRLKQVEQAYEINSRIKLDPEATYILFDDVWTTGASMRTAYRLLKTAGAKKIVIAVLSVSEMD